VGHITAVFGARQTEIVCFVMDDPLENRVNTLDTSTSLDPVNSQGTVDKSQASAKHPRAGEALSDKILCPHCLRTATNGIQCKGMCVADSDY
jgi:hypothetical protein